MALHQTPPEANGKILLVDDEPANLLALEAVLEGLGAELICAHSGEEALALVDAHEFALVVLDVRMPGIDGYEVARRIRAEEKSRHLPIIFVTAHDTPERVVVQAYREGAADHLVKPLVPDVLRSKAGSYLEAHRQSLRIRQLEQREFERQLAEERQRTDRERLHAEQARLRLAAIVECSDDAIIGETLAGTIVAWNQGAERLYGFTEQEMLGKSLSLLVPADGQHEFAMVLERLKRGERVEPFETVNVRKDGELVQVSVSASPIRGPGGEIVGVSVIARDITRLKEVEHELRRANRAKDDFLAMLSHELRNPLAPLRNAMHVLERRGADPPTVAWAHEIALRQLKHLSRLVDDLLEVSRINRGKIHLRPERVDLADLVRTTVEDHRPLLEGAGLGLVVDIPPQPVWVRGDSVRLGQVLSNLLNNAGKFSRPQGLITVEVREDQAARRAVVVVRDTGIGIEPELLGRVFDVFAQGEADLDRSRGGLGLGLALVKGLVELHDGTVQAASAGTGKGAEFTIQLPLDTSSPYPASQGTRTDQAGRRLRVLLIEDHADAAESLRVILEMAGHQATVAHTGAEGIETARRIRPDVILCDLGLPGIDGYQVGRTIHGDAAVADACLIAVSGYGQEEDRRRSQEAGFAYHLTKPIDPDELLGLLGTVAPST
jgi:PAS domain S-box-containing protein